MDYEASFAISAAGMAAERTRVETASLNLANLHAVQAPHGSRYEPLRAVIRAATAFEGLVAGGLDAPAGPAVSVEETGASPRLVHEPGHPLADAKGFVAYPGVDSATEMVTLMSALRSYEANVAAMNTARTLALKALEIGRSA